MSKPNPAIVQEATKWLRSLPTGKKLYYREHYKLNDPARLVRFYLNTIKPQEAR